MGDECIDAFSYKNCKRSGRRSLFFSPVDDNGFPPAEPQPPHTRKKEGRRAFGDRNVERQGTLRA